MSGVVTLDGPHLDEITLGQLDGMARAKAVILHELGHLVGLDHVDDPSQLMYHQSSVTTLQGGDRAGLAELGRGACIRQL
jgi:predicted Zn-dependent protease